jgi:signal transduction histidine kinase
MMAIIGQSGVPDNLNVDATSAQKVAAAPRAVDTDQRLDTMFEIARILATERDLETMVPRLLTSLMHSLPTADAGVLLLHDPATDHLVVKAAQGYDMNSLQDFRLLPGESIAGQSFLAGRAGLYATPEATAAGMRTLSADNRVILRAAAEAALQPRSAICIPLVTNQVKVGVLVFEDLRLPGAFTAEDLAFLQPVADLLALAIENVRLIRELDTVRSLDEANRLKAEVISTLAHEMRTPLTSIKGYSSALLMEEASFAPDTQREFLKIIDEECDVLQDLIHDLLESSMIDAGFLRLELQPVRLPRLARVVLDDFAHYGAGYRFMVDFPAEFPIVDADPQRVTQVLRNLVDNAVKYSPDGGLVVVRGEVREDEVVVSVADQGVGIAPEHLNRLFEKFFRIKSGLGRHVVGSGLGLPISRAIVESHGGRIWAESQVDQGTTLCFTLPRRSTGIRVVGSDEGEVA